MKILQIASSLEKQLKARDDIVALSSGSSTDAKITLPKMKDDEMDFDDHVRRFEALITSDRTKISDATKLRLFGDTLQTTGSSGNRKSIYELAKKIAEKQGRLPQEAEAVYQEIIAKIKITSHTYPCCVSRFSTPPRPGA